MSDIIQKETFKTIHQITNVLEERKRSDQLKSSDNNPKTSLNNISWYIKQSTYIGLFLCRRTCAITARECLFCLVSKICTPPY